MSRGSERQRETENVRKGRTESDVRDLESWVTMRTWCLCESLYANTMCKAATRAGMDHRRTHPPESSRIFFALFPLPSSARGWGLLVRLSRSFGFLAPLNGHLFRRLQRLLFVKSCFQTAGCVLSVRNPKLSCGICFLLQKVRISHCLLMEWGFVDCMARHVKATFFRGSSIVSLKRISKPTPARIWHARLATEGEEEDRRQQIPAIPLAVITSQRGCKLSPPYSENGKAGGETCKCFRVPGTWDSSSFLFLGCWILAFFLLEAIGFFFCLENSSFCWRELDSSSVNGDSSSAKIWQCNLAASTTTMPIPVFCACLMCIRTIPPPVKGKNNHCNEGEQCNLCATKIPSACLVCYASALEARKLVTIGDLLGGG